MSDPIIILCQNEIKGNPNNLISFLHRHGQEVVSIVDTGIIFTNGVHYLINPNSECTGCEYCTPKKSL